MCRPHSILTVSTRVQCIDTGISCMHPAPAIIGPAISDPRNHPRNGMALSAIHRSPNLLSWRQLTFSWTRMRHSPRRLGCLNGLGVGRRQARGKKGKKALEGLKLAVPQPSYVLVHTRAARPPHQHHPHHQRPVAPTARVHMIFADEGLLQIVLCAGRFFPPRLLCCATGTAPDP